MAPPFSPRAASSVVVLLACVVAFSTGGDRTRVRTVTELVSVVHYTPREPAAAAPQPQVATFAQPGGTALVPAPQASPADIRVDAAPGVVKVPLATPGPVVIRTHAAGRAFAPVTRTGTSQKALQRQPSVRWAGQVPAAHVGPARNDATHGASWRVAARRPAGVQLAACHAAACARGAAARLAPRQPALPALFVPIRDFGLFIQARLQLARPAKTAAGPRRIA